VLRQLLIGIIPLFPLFALSSRSILCDAVPAWYPRYYVVMALAFAVSNGIGNQCD
jgi:uncharacterized membrane protein (GlpM family)